ncbi:MAG: nucleotidyltransferase family protein [Microcystaceae cyanobacterium]
MNISTIPVILAGGFGTRIKHLLPDIPKPMAEVAGKPFIEWILNYLENQGFSQALLSTGHLGNVIADYFNHHPLAGMTISCHRELIPLGTAGGFVQAVEQSALTPDAWLVMNGDSLVFTELMPFLKYFEDEEIDGVVLGIEVEDASRYGLLSFDEENFLEEFVEKRPGSGIINGGVYLFRSHIVQQFPLKRPLSFEEDVFPTLLNDQIKIKIHVVSAPFLDIGTPESLPQADNFIQKTLISKQ